MKGEEISLLKKKKNRNGSNKWLEKKLQHHEAKTK